MTKLTEEERQRLCVAKFRDMSDEMLSEMPGSVLELAKKYHETTRKFRKMSDIFIMAADHLPSDIMIRIMVELSADRVTNGEKSLDEVIAELEGLKEQAEKE